MLYNYNTLIYKQTLNFTMIFLKIKKISGFLKFLLLTFLILFQLIFSKTHLLVTMSYLNYLFFYFDIFKNMIIFCYKKQIINPPHMLSTFVICFLNQAINACIKPKGDEIEPFKLRINGKLQFVFDFNQSKDEYTEQMYEISEQINNSQDFFKFETLPERYIDTELRKIKIKENQREGIVAIIDMYNKKYDQTNDVEHLNTFNDLRDIANIIVVYMKNEKNYIACIQII